MPPQRRFGKSWRIQTFLRSGLSCCLQGAAVRCRKTLCEASTSWSLAPALPASVPPFIFRGAAGACSSSTGRGPARCRRAETRACWSGPDFFPSMSLRAPGRFSRAFSDVGRACESTREPCPPCGISCAMHVSTWLLRRWGVSRVHSPPYRRPQQGSIWRSRGCQRLSLFSPHRLAEDPSQRSRSRLL